MENTYYLIVEQQAGGQCVRTIDEYASADRLVAAHPLPDIAASVHAELASRLEWCERQAALERWPDARR